MQSSVSADAVKRAVCAALDADERVSAVLSNRMAFRDVRAFRTFPFLAIGHRLARGPAPGRGEEHLVSVHLWMKPGQEAKATSLGDVIRDALDQARLRIPGADIAGFWHEVTSTRHSPELDALHTTIRYRLRVSPGNAAGGRGSPPGRPRLGRSRAI